MPNIRDFLKEMRRKNEVKEATEKRVEDPMPSTQEIIEDARERRIMNKKGKTHLECEMCPFKSESKYIMKRHIKTHQSTSIQDEVFKSNPGTGTIEARTPSNTEPGENAYKSTSKVSRKVTKRIQCEKCDKKVNKEETFNVHMEKFHKQNPVGIGPDTKSSEKIVNTNENPPPIFKLMTRMTLRSEGSRDLPTKENSNAPVVHIDKE